MFGGTRDARIFAPMGDEDIAIGRAFDTVTGVFTPNQPCLQGFEAVDNRDMGNTQQTRLVQVTNSLDLMRTLNIDVAASGQIYGTKLSGKAGFAGSTTFQQTNLNYALYSDYVAHPRFLRAAQGDTVRLTDAAQAALEQGEAAFRKACGDSYVRGLTFGAEVYAVMSFTTVDASERRAISGAMGASGAGWSVSTAASQQIEKSSSSDSLRITYGQTGGFDHGADAASDDVATKWSKLEDAVDALPNASDPVVTAFQVVSYDTLASWDGPDLTPSPDLLQLAYYMASYRSLSSSVKQLIDAGRQAEFTHVMRRQRDKGAGDQESLSQLQTDLIDAQTTIGKLYEACSSWQVGDPPASCATTEALLKSLKRSDTTLAQATDPTPDPYVFMARMPLEMETPRDALMGGDNLAEAIFQQHLVFARNGYCAQSEMLGLRYEACQPIATLRDTYLAEISANVTNTWSPGARGYMFASAFRPDACLTAWPAGDDETNPFMRSCNKAKPEEAKQRFAWRADGRIMIRKAECLAGPIKLGARVGPHRCAQEPQQFWRFIPTTADGNIGLMQEVGFGRCLSFGTPVKDRKTWARTQACNFNNPKLQWILIAK
ncbi:ricin-type beta-trefoil lectin domain protein [Roseovarius sp.]|uniref:ricin-type beta-trefoil lectin domain protein n=1 Tax=Roseovarius sp. TaxID=1486281 RepID=UPI003563C530